MRSYEKGGWRCVERLAVFRFWRARQDAHVLVYVNEKQNFRAVVIFFSPCSLPFCTFNGGAPENFRVFEKYF